LSVLPAGESYGGVYVPLLTQRLLQHNQELAAGSSSSGSSSSSRGQPYNLAGYIVGNAVTDDATDSRGQVEYAYGLGLVDPGTYKDALDTCQVRAVCNVVWSFGLVHMGR
jgi:carboxypeptidase C (cathepsin A)